MTLFKLIHATYFYKLGRVLFHYLLCSLGVPMLSKDASTAAVTRIF